MQIELYHNEKKNIQRKMSEMPGRRRPVPGPQFKYPVLHKKILVEHQTGKNVNFLFKVYFFGSK